MWKSEEGRRLREREKTGAAVEAHAGRLRWFEVACSAALRVALDCLLCPSNSSAMLCYALPLPPSAVLLGQNGRLHHSPVDTRLTMTRARAIGPAKHLSCCCSLHR